MAINETVLRAILQESEAVGNEKFLPPFNSCVEVGYLGG